ncbi:TetR/AcrR family transcriptional regulator [Parashewanella spongiae]|uniref:TetR/AcrR family transcriptional regulator n=1 Tax=Parashewanella spongiae TaxID=342950 RepID=A0A3A6TI89_9GAMM|nr:TetR/AcrR family transcriptional regulator [Parashewanella spongiae]MCL1078528.1 TetR/AcrR family transcriptional regulator [Parashewanella spongiae]RJY13454.1 TetR/AcrR family transcriptional regulator [Parashewanella spongiae]
MANKREQILRSAEKIIAQEGIQHLSMQKLADDAKIAAGTIYRYFKDKDQLISELRVNILQSVAAFVFTDARAGNVEQRFKHIWFNFVRLGCDRTPQQLNYQQFYLLPGVNTAEHNAIARETFKPLEDLFTEGIQQHLVLNLQIEYLFSIAFEPAISLGRRIFEGHLHFNQQELQKACDICWHAITYSNHL